MMPTSTRRQRVVERRRRIYPVPAPAPAEVARREARKPAEPPAEETAVSAAGLTLEDFGGRSDALGG
jgi:hypothetical protein